LGRRRCGVAAAGETTESRALTAFVDKATGAGHGVRDQRVQSDRLADKRLGAGAGLSGEVAGARLERYGPNALEERRRSVVLELLSHFWQPIPWMIEAALVLTAVTARWTDFGVILALLLLNGLVGSGRSIRQRTRSRRSSNGWPSKRG
jgi:magnesium-transporting ATPase (P-type)